MLLPIFIISLLHLALASPIHPVYDVEDIEQLKYHFNDFKVKYNKTYTDEEESLRFNIFKENLAKINELNRDNPITDFGINQFTDWSAKDMEILYGVDGATLGDGYGACSAGVAADIEPASVSDGIDWRQRNAVAPVQNQGNCGSCWSFSSAGSLRCTRSRCSWCAADCNLARSICATVICTLLEGAYALKHNTLLKVSEQQFVDCDTQSSGCGGGWPHFAISSTIQLGGQELEEDYPYTGQQQQCQFDVNKAQVKATSCKVYPDIGDTDGRLESLLTSAGPLSITLDATDALQHYNGGIFVTCETQEPNHAVTLVGYGDEGGVPYWIVKNSWGEGWGENGYVRVKKGEGCLMIGGYVLSAEVA